MLKLQALSLLLVATWGSTSADLVINGDWNSAVFEGSSQLLPVNLLVEENDLFSVSTIRMNGLDDESITFSKTKSTKKSNGQISWRGNFDAGIGFVTLIQEENGDIAGSLSTTTAAYSVAKLAATGSYQLRRTLWKDFPEDSSALENEELQEPQTKSSYRPSWNSRFRNIFNHIMDNSDANDADTKTAANMQEPDETTVSLIMQSNKPLEDQNNAISVDGVGSVVPHGNDRFLRGDNRTLQENNIVDVLVVVTNRAMCEYTGLREGCDGTDASNNRDAIVQRISVLEEETNTAFSDTDIPVQIRVVDIIILSPGFDGRTTQDTLETIRTNPTIREWRENVGADLVSFITGDGGRVCGIAYLNSFESANAYNCLDEYVFSHELGHNFGARHDRTSTSVFQRHPYAHGLRSAGEFRTIMAYQCAEGCPLIPYFSANGYQLTDGTPIGDADNDNARMIRERARSIANFQPTVIGGNTPTPPTPTPPTPTPPTPTPPTPTPPTPTPPTIDPETTCPASSSCAPEDNLMRFSVFRFLCYESCVAESAVDFRERFGWTCGGC